jgi:hypothetical protein
LHSHGENSVDFANAECALGHGGAGAHSFATQDGWWTADLRLTNRSEVVRQLPASEVVHDLALFARWLEHAGFNGLDEIYGDYVFAHWDLRHRALIVGRAPLSTKSLFVAVSPQAAAFSTHPSALRNLPG